MQPKQESIGEKDIQFWLNKIGTNFRALILHTDHGKRWSQRPKWQAKANHHIAKFGKSIFGNTSEEALESLYNELKKANKIN